MKAKRLRDWVLSAKGVIVPTLLVSLLLLALLVWNTVRINRASEALSDSIRRNLSCAELCAGFSRASDALNTCATDYILAGRQSTLEDYFAQRQSVWDSADGLRALLDETGLSTERQWVKQALRAVEERGLVELRAMRLGAHALEKDLGDFPELGEDRGPRHDPHAAALRAGRPEDVREQGGDQTRRERTVGAGTTVIIDVPIYS